MAVIDEGVDDDIDGDDDESNTGLESVVRSPEKRRGGFRRRFNAKNRLQAACMFFRSIVRYNTKISELPKHEKSMSYKQRLISAIPKCFRKYIGITTIVPEQYDRSRWSDRLAAPICEPFKTPIIYGACFGATITAIPFMRYDPMNGQYVLGE